MDIFKRRRGNRVEQSSTLAFPASVAAGCHRGMSRRHSINSVTLLQAAVHQKPIKRSPHRKEGERFLLHFAHMKTSYSI